MFSMIQLDIIVIRVCCDTCWHAGRCEWNRYEANI